MICNSSEVLFRQTEFSFKMSTRLPNHPRARATDSSPLSVPPTVVSDCDSNAGNCDADSSDLSSLGSLSDLEFESESESDKEQAIVP
jgi:hypothetical protein